MDGIERVRTARLVGTRPVFRDADDLQPLMADERAADWLWPGDLGGPRTLSQVRGLLVKDVDHWKRRGWGPWMVRDAATGAAVGRVGLQAATVGDGDDAEVVEVLWLIDPERWGEGLAAEMARAAVDAALGPLGLPEVVAFTLHDNLASRRVMEKCGLAYERDIVHAGLPHVLYRIRRPG